MRRSPSRRGLALPVLAVLVPGCAGPLIVGGGPCSLERAPVGLPAAVPESSGVEPVGDSSGDIVPGAFWTHNDSGWDPVLFAVDHEGRLLAEIAVTGARNVDWEDLAAGPCAGRGRGDEGPRCLYIADTGDNEARRTDPAIYRVQEPRLDASRTTPAERIPLRFPHGPRDVEAFAFLPDGRGLLISKGRNHPIEVYRTPVPLALAESGEPLLLERIQDLPGRPPLFPSYVTGAASNRDGTVVAVRTYDTLRFYRPGPDGVLESIEGGVVNLRPLREPQGEAVAFLAEAGVVLTSEAGPGGREGQLSVLRCQIPG